MRHASAKFCIISDAGRLAGVAPAKLAKQAEPRFFRDEWSTEALFLDR
jgi:hypothetical protein